MQSKLPHNVIGLLDSFLAVAENPNISQAANSLNISRLTLKNKLAALEELCGFQLLEFGSFNRYKLTARAETWIQEVRVWLRQGEDVFSLSDERATGLLQSAPIHDDESLYSQQHPLTSLWEHDTPYLQSMLQAWIKAEANFSSPAFSRVRQNAILARPHNDEFIIIGIGKNAAMVKWLGKEWCLSAVGKPLSSTAMSSRADKILIYSYRQAILHGSPWYDHVSVELPRPEKNSLERAYYKRLILPCKFPDGSPFIASIVELSDDLVIAGLEVRRVSLQTVEG